MTELEKMQRAKMYLDKLALGVNPLNDEKMPADTLLNNARLSRLFVYVSGVLGCEIENNSRRKPDLPFIMFPEQAASVALSDEPINVTELTKRINSVLDPDVSRKVMVKSITGWLLSKGFLSENTDSSGKKYRRETPRGETLGIKSELRSSVYSGVSYFFVLYGKNAQRFILDNLPEIMSDNTGTASTEGKQP